MSLFFKDRDINTLTGISRQLVEKVMQVEVLYVKLDVQKMQVNIYGQAKRKIKAFYPGVVITALVDHQPYQIEYSNFYKYKRNVTFKFLESTLKHYKINPQVGDIIGWNNSFWEISKIRNSQLIGNMAKYKWSRLCQTNILSQRKVRQLKELKVV